MGIFCMHTARATLHGWKSNQMLPREHYICKNEASWSPWGLIFPGQHIHKYWLPNFNFALYLSGYRKERFSFEAYFKFVSGPFCSILIHYNWKVDKYSYIFHISFVALSVLQNSFGGFLSQCRYSKFSITILRMSKVHLRSNFRPF